MSALTKISNSSGDLLVEKIPEVLWEYKRKMADSDKDLSLTGKNLNDALQENQPLGFYYDNIRAEVGTLSKFLQVQIDKRVGELNKLIKETSKYDHSDRSVDKMIGKDDTYIFLSTIKLEVDELLKKLNYLCKQFDQRSYTLSNIVTVYKHELQEQIITREYE